MPLGALQLQATLACFCFCCRRVYLIYLNTQRFLPAGLSCFRRRVNIGKTSCKMSYLLNAPYGAVFELDGNKLVRVDGELVEAEEEPPGEVVVHSTTRYTVEHFLGLGQDFLECWGREGVEGGKNGPAAELPTATVTIVSFPWSHWVVESVSWGAAEGRRWGRQRPKEAGLRVWIWYINYLVSYYCCSVPCFVGFESTRPTN